MRKIIRTLKEYTKAYDEGHPIVSDKEYDDLYFKLKNMEEESGIIYPDSPTQTIIFDCMTKLNKVEHSHPMLSLDKTKEISEIFSFLDHRDFTAMAKMDGLTCSLRYEDGVLVSAETRGNGLVGEDITHNAIVIPSIPKHIPYEGVFVVDGEIVCTYKDFEKWSETYKNPRNFASGSIRLLDAYECSSRDLTFVAWDIIEGCEEKFFNWKLEKLESYGFTVVPALCGDAKTDLDSLIEITESLKEIASYNSYPIDGLVFKFNDVEYGKSLGSTEHHFRNAIAYKFYDETYETRLIDIEWSMGRTGILTPVAIFEPVDMDGTTVSRASLHNYSVLDETLGTPVRNQKLWVYKANQIIPQIYMAEKHPEATSSFGDIGYCPCCNSKLVILEHNGIKDLFCDNPQCDAKIINQLDHLCGKSGLDIKGLSKATLEKLLDWGWIETAEDIFKLENHTVEWKKKPGFGVASVNKVLTAIENAKNTDLNNFIVAIGIPLIGRAQSKEICKVCKTYEDFREKVNNNYDWSNLDTFGEVKSSNINNFNYEIADKIYNYLNINKIEEVETTTKGILNNLTFVITGKLNSYKNRDELKTIIENNGGKVASSISKTTSYLINNDLESTSSKNVKAKQLNIPIIDEKYFQENILIF